MARSARWPQATFAALVLSLAAAGCGGGGGGGASAGGGGELTSHLAGDWTASSIASGYGAPWFSRGRLTVTAAGVTTGRLDFYGEPSEAVTTSMSLSADRLWTIAVNGTAQGSVDALDRIIAYTASFGSGAAAPTEMGVALRMAPSYATTDLAGTWETRSLAAGGGAAYWGSSVTTFAADGSYVSTTTTNAGGAATATSGRLLLSPDGVTTLAAGSDFRGAMDALKTVMVSTLSTNGGTRTELRVSVKRGASYAQADLAGTWRSYTLASGPGEPWWERASGTIDAAGQFAGSTTESDGSGGPKAATFTLSSDGHVSLAGGSIDGVLDASKTVITWVDTWTGAWRPGTTELKVLVKIR